MIMSLIALDKCPQNYKKNVNQMLTKKVYQSGKCM